MSTVHEQGNNITVNAKLYTFKGSDFTTFRVYLYPYNGILATVKINCKRLSKQSNPIMYT